MPGFLIGNNQVVNSLTDICSEKFMTDKYEIAIEGNNIFALRNTLYKFIEDKCFKDTTNLFIIQEGYLLNKTALFQKYHTENMAALIEIMYGLKGEVFFQDFRGCFSGAVYDKAIKKWIIYTNQIGDNPIFYYKKEDLFVAGSQISYILDYCKANKSILTVDETCIYQILSYGFVANDATYAKEIKRLHGGDYLIFQDGSLEIRTYHRFRKNRQKYKYADEKQIIEDIDKTFREAVRLEWEKDKEYGLSHLADLSGGLDSRMNLWCAHEMGYRDAKVLTYCKSGYLDEIIAKEITNYWNDDILFRALDNADFMYDIDINTFMLGGLSLYSGITGGRRLLASLNMDHFGIEHTGMVGDAVLGSFYRSNTDARKRKPTGRYSETLSGKLPANVVALHEQYDDYEIYLMYVRGFHGACNSHLIRRNYTEVGSPFLNVEFMQLCYDIPVELRMNHKIYKKWIINKYPNAAKFRWEKTAGLIDESDFRRKFRRYRKGILRRVNRFLTRSKIQPVGMNPIDYWISQNRSLKAYLDEYENEGYCYLPAGISDQLVKDMKQLYKTGNATEKAMVLTVLASAKLYFGKQAYGKIILKN